MDTDPSDFALSLTLELRRRRLLARAGGAFGNLEGAALADVEAAAEWGTVRAGETLVRQGDAGDSLFVLVTGRLAAFREHPDGTRTPLGEVGPGESVGEMAFFTGGLRTATVEAMRDCLLLRFTNGAFERVTARHPALLRQVTRVQIERLQRRDAVRRPTPVTNVCVIPAGDPADAAALCRALAEALAPFGDTMHLTASGVDAALERPGVADAADGTRDGSRLRDWLGEQELAHRFVVYETDPAHAEWSRRAVRLADRILIVADASASPEPAAFERDVLHGATARRTLVLRHAESTERPRGTARWLARPGRLDHVHVRAGRAADIARLARSLAGRAIGLALGGGGARALAQIGLFDALDEAGIPVDVIGGTSIGAAMAAQRIMGWDGPRILRENRRVFCEAQVQKDWTLPFLSLLGPKANRLAREIYGDLQIEDLWLPFFAVASSLTSTERVILRRGPVWQAVIASSSLPGISLPMLIDGHLLVDGALTDNLPGGVLREMDCGHVIVCRASTDAEPEFTVDHLPSLGAVLRGLAIRRPLRHPNMVDVLGRAGMLASVERERAEMRAADLAFEPPVMQYGLMQFEAMDRISVEGYRYAVERLRAFRESGALERILAPC